MATSNVSYGFRVPADYPDTPVLAESSTIHTDTESEPTPSVTGSYTPHAPFNANTRDTTRTVQVQTKVFRTDYSNAGAAQEYQSCYISVTKDKL